MLCVQSTPGSCTNILKLLHVHNVFVPCEHSNTVGGGKGTSEEHFVNISRESNPACILAFGSRVGYGLHQLCQWVLCVPETSSRVFMSCLAILA